MAKLSGLGKILFWVFAPIVTLVALVFLSFNLYLYSIYFERVSDKIIKPKVIIGEFGYDDSGVIKLMDIKELELWRSFPYYGGRSIHPTNNVSFKSKIVNAIEIGTVITRLHLIVSENANAREMGLYENHGSITKLWSIEIPRIWAICAKPKITDADTNTEPVIALQTGDGNICQYDIKGLLKSKKLFEKKFKIGYKIGFGFLLFDGKTITNINGDSILDLPGGSDIFRSFFLVPSHDEPDGKVFIYDGRSLYLVDLVGRKINSQQSIFWLEKGYFGQQFICESYNGLVWINPKNGDIRPVRVVGKAGLLGHTKGYRFYGDISFDDYSICLFAKQNGHNYDILLLKVTSNGVSQLFSNSVACDDIYYVKTYYNSIFMFTNKGIYRAYLNWVLLDD